MAHVVTPTHTARASDHSAKFKASPVHLAHQMLLPGGPVSPDDNSPVVGALTPGQVRTADGINLLPNMGAGTTIGVVDIFNDPSIVGDLAAFSNQDKLPQLDGIGNQVSALGIVKHLGRFPFGREPVEVLIITRTRQVGDTG